MRDQAIDLREALQLGGAVRAAHSLDGDLGLAVGAHLGGGLCRCGGSCRLLVQAVDELDHHKQHKGHDEEVDDRVDEFADLDAGTAQADHDIREICLEEQADQRVDDVIHQSRDDGRERTADDHADCHIQHIAAHGKGLEFLKEFLDPLDLFFWHKNDRSFSNSPCVREIFFAFIILDLQAFCKGCGAGSAGCKKAGPASAGPA